MRIGDLPLEKLIAHEACYMAMMATIEKTPCAWFVRAPDLPDYRDANRALHLRDDGRGPEVVAREVIAYFRTWGLPPVADIDAMAEAQGIGAVLRRLGLAPVLGDWLLMRYPHAAPPFLLPRGVQVQIVPNETGAGEAQDWVETALDDGEVTTNAALWRDVTEREARCPLCRLYLGRLDNQPAGTCDLFSVEGWGRIEMVATRPPFRRRGVASTLVARAVDDSLSHGNEITYLFTEAGGTGEQVYTRLGFVPWGVNVLRRHIGTG